MDLLFAGKYSLNYKVRDGELISGIATGDLRNFFEPILSIPEGAKQEFGICLNDIETDIVLRNAIILLLAFSTPDGEVCELIIHLW
jgi:hypothetical protein